MQSIQLYISGERVELFDDESVTLTQTIQNVKDIGSIFTDFSQSFSVPASKVNNKIFKHYYNYEIDPAYSFSANDIVSAEIQLNWRTFRKGFIALDGVQLKNNKAYAYKLTFFGETIDLKNKLKETKLSTVFQSVNTYDHTYNVTNVKTGLQTSLVSGAVRYPLISHSERLYYESGGSHAAGDRNIHFDDSGGSGGSHNHGVYYTDLKPALKVSKIVEEIENYADLTFSSGASDDFFDETNNPIWGNLYLWLSRVKGPLGLNVSGTAEINMPITDVDFSGASPRQWYPELQGSQSTVSPYSRVENGVWTCRPQYDPSGIDGHFYRVIFRVNSTSNYTMRIEEVTGDTVVRGSLTSTGNNFLLYNITTFNTSGELRSFRFRVISDDPTITFTPTLEFRYIQSDPLGGVDNYDTSVTGSYIEPNGAVSDIVVADQVPDIKVIDFLTGLFKMFNLTAYVQNDGTIKVLTLDEFYNSGTEYDISQYVDANQSEVNFSIPYQEIAFRFPKPSTFLAFNFNQLNNKVFGDLENTTVLSPEVETTNRGNKYVVQLPFGKMLYERLTDITDGSETPFQYGYCTDKDQNPTNIEPLVMVIENEDCSTDKLGFYNGTSSGVAAGLTSYNRPSNVYAGTSDQSINFGEEVDEYTGEAEENSLFYTYYRNYIVDTFNQKRRLTKVTAYLPLRILLNYSLADVFVINNRKYIINSIKTNLKDGKSELELLNVL